MNRRNRLKAGQAVTKVCFDLYDRYSAKIFVFCVLHVFALAYKSYSTAKIRELCDSRLEPLGFFG